MERGRRSSQLGASLIGVQGAGGTAWRQSVFRMPGAALSCGYQSALIKCRVHSAALCITGRESESGRCLLAFD